MLVVEKECGMGRRCVDQRRWLRNSTTVFLEHCVKFSQLTRNLFFFRALDLGPSGTVKMFLVGESHSRGERNWRWVPPPLWDFCCVRIVEHGVPYPSCEVVWAGEKEVSLDLPRRREREADAAAVWPSNIVKARFHKMLHASKSNSSFLAVKTLKL